MLKQPSSKEFERYLFLYIAFRHLRHSGGMKVRLLMHQSRTLLHPTCRLTLISDQTHQLQQLFQLLFAYQKKVKHININSSLVCPHPAGDGTQPSVQKLFIFNESWGFAVGGMTAGDLHRAERATLKMYERSEAVDHITMQESVSGGVFSCHWDLLCCYGAWCVYSK